MSDILKLQALINFWCGKRHSGEHEKDAECRKNLMEKLKVVGDKLKEKLVAAVDENDISYDTFKKIEKLRALLMAAELAGGKSGTFFSIENIRWAKKEVARKALAWVINRSNTFVSLEDLQEFYRLVAAGSSIYAPGELEPWVGGNHLFPGQQGLASLRYRARRMLLQKMANMDICNPDPGELKALQDELNKYPGCEKLLGNADACKSIMSGNLEFAYNKLYEQDRGDEANNSDPNKAKEPVDCNKKPVITPDFKVPDIDDVADVTYKLPEIHVEVESVDEQEEELITEGREEAVGEEPVEDDEAGEVVEENDPWWEPKLGTTWQWQLSGNINTSYDVDMYDIDLVETPQSIINRLHADEKKVICYFSAGSMEEYRDDAGAFPSEILGNILDGWEDERWLDISNYEIFAPVMEARLDMAVHKKCDGVEPDNVDAYTNDTGFELSYSDQLKYNKWLAREAHNRGLSVALKNDLDQIPELVNYFDFAINEQCFQYNECDALLPFIEHGKAVFGVEYEMSAGQFCEQANDLGFDWLKTNYDLNGSHTACRKYKK